MNTKEMHCPKLVVSIRQVNNHREEVLTITHHSRMVSVKGAITVKKEERTTRTFSLCPPIKVEKDPSTTIRPIPFTKDTKIRSTSI